MNRFIGRHAELEELTCRVESARAGSRGLLLISSEAGIGKTRLVEEATRIAVAHPVLTTSMLM